MYFEAEFNGDDETSLKRRHNLPGAPLRWWSSVVTDGAAIIASTWSRADWMKHTPMPQRSSPNSAQSRRLRRFRRVR
jgi:hypothetical protein